MVARCETPDDEWSRYFPDGVGPFEGKTETDLLYDEIKRYRDALVGLYKLCECIYLGTEPAYLIRYHLATNDSSIAAARILGCDRIGNPERHPNTDPRDPDPKRDGIFREHNCWRCRDGANPCPQGNPRQCEYPHARND